MGNEWWSFNSSASSWVNTSNGVVWAGRSRVQDDKENFAAFMDFQSSPLSEMTIEHNPFGFDARSIFALPQLDGDERPTPDGPAAAAQNDLFQHFEEWPGSDSSDVGAFPPASSSCGTQGRGLFQGVVAVFVICYISRHE